MSVATLLFGGLLILFAAVDALWTTLWVDGRAGPLTRRHTTWTRRLLWRIIPRGHHRLLSAVGPTVLVTSLAIWTLLLWTAWVILFAADPGSLVHSRTGEAAALVDRVYFVGSTLFTMGGGNFSPAAPAWQVATAVASLSGFFLITLVVSYLVSILQAVVQKRSFAGQVQGLGRTAEEVLLHSWDGQAFPGLDQQFVSLTEQLNASGDRHIAYPLVYFYHEARERESVPRAVAVFDDALALLRYGVEPGHGPGPAVLHGARESVRAFLETVRAAYVSPADEPPPLPDLARLREAGIPTVEPEVFAARMEETRDRRCVLLGFLREEGRPWPGTADGGATRG